jgi:tripartite-type tricarboxylate transporter receptor subunit TctC
MTRLRPGDWWAARLFLGVLSLISTDATRAQDYPDHPITLIVPFPPGGSTEALARILAERMRVTLGQPIVVEDVGGAGGTIGTGRVARAASDGYTLEIGNISTHVLNGAVYALKYDVVEDFSPVSLLADTPLVIVARGTMVAKNLSDLVAGLKTSTQASVGVVGAGDLNRIVGIYFQRRVGADFVYVPYRGGGPILQDLIAGQIDLSFGPLAAVLAQLRAGSIKAYAVMADSRSPAAPDIPTIDEGGVSGLYASFWHGLWAPKATPGPIVAKINEAVVEALSDESVQKRLADLAQTLPARTQQTPEALRGLQKAEIAKWWPIIRAAGVKAE